MPRPTPAPPPPPPPPAARDVDVERDALIAMRADGTLDALRARAVERVRADPEMKTFTEFAARASQTLRDPRARRASRKDLVDALFRECGGQILEQADRRVWEALTDTRDELGRAAYEATFAAMEDARRAR